MKWICAPFLLTACFSTTPGPGGMSSDGSDGSSASSDDSTSYAESSSEDSSESDGSGGSESDSESDSGAIPDLPEVPESDCGFFEGWEDGEIAANGWSTTGEWAISSEDAEVHTGLFSVASPVVQYVDLLRTFNIDAESAVLSFWIKGGSFEVWVDDDFWGYSQGAADFAEHEVIIAGEGDHDVIFRTYLGVSYIDTISVDCN